VEAAYLEQNWRKYKDQGVPETFFIAKNGELRDANWPSGVPATG